MECMNRWCQTSTLMGGLDCEIQIRLRSIDWDVLIGNFSSIESPVVRTIIEVAVLEEKSCQPRLECHYFPRLPLEPNRELTESLKTGRNTGVLVDVLRMAIRYNVLTGVLKGAREGDVMKDILVEAKKSVLLSRVVKHCDEYTATSLVRGAIECGMFNDVLREAVECGNVKTVLMGARGVDVMKDVLMEAKKSVLLSQVVKHCDEYTATSLVRGAIECGMLNDVLREAVECENVKTVLMGARGGDVMKDVLMEAKTSVLLSRVVKHCDGYTATLLVRGAVECGMLSDILVGTEGRRNVRAILNEVDAFCRTLVEDVKHCVNWSTAGHLIRNAIQCGVLNEVLREAVKLGKMGILVKSALNEHLVFPHLKSTRISETMQILLEEAVSIGASRVVLTEVMNCGLFDLLLDFVANKLLGLHKLGRNTEVVSNLLGSLLSHTEASGKLRRYMMVLQRLNVPREYIEQAAKDQAILKEVLEAKRLIELFEMFIFVFTLLSVKSNARSKDKGHCSSEHRKHVIDHVTIRSGDIEANPGPVFYFNDWLKEMFALTVSLVRGFQGKNIRWKELGIPNPHHGLDRSKLKALFHEHAQIVHDAESLIPYTHTEEFQLLKTYIERGQELDLDKLEKLVEKRKVKVTWQEFWKRFQSLPPLDQEDIVQHLDTEQMGFKLVNMREQSEDGDETGDAVSEDEEGVSEDLGHQEAFGQVEEPTEMMENRSTPVGHTGQVDEPTEIMENRSRPTEHTWQLGNSVLPPALIATSESPIEERGISEGTGKQDEPKPGPSKEQAYGSHRTTGDRIDSGDPKRSQQQGTSPPGSQQQGTSPPGSQQQGTSPPGSQQQGTSPPGSQQQGPSLPGRQGLSADESELLDILQVQGIFNYLEPGATARHVECQPEADGIPQDILELLLDQHNSGTREDTNNSKQTDADNKLTNGTDCGVTVRKDGSSPGQDGVADDKTQPDLSDDRMKLMQLIHRYEILLHNFEKVTGLQNADQRLYDTGDIEIPVEKHVLCGKRQASSNLLQEDGSASKYTKFQ